MPDAVGAAGKPVGVVLSSLSACIHAVEVQVEIHPPKGSRKVDFRMVMVLRSEELARTAHMEVQPTHGTVHDSHSPRS